MEEVIDAQDYLKIPRSSAHSAVEAYQSLSVTSSPTPLTFYAPTRDVTDLQGLDLSHIMNSSVKNQKYYQNAQDAKW